MSEQPKLTVVPLGKPTVDDRSKNNVVELLEEWLRRAKAGHFKALAIVGLELDDKGEFAASYGWRSNDKMIAMLGAANCLVHDIYDQLKDHPTTPAPPKDDEPPVAS